jgi:hypothetical protein
LLTTLPEWFLLGFSLLFPGLHAKPVDCDVFSQESPPLPEKDSSQSKSQVVHPFTVDEKVLIKVRFTYHAVFFTLLLISKGIASMA